MKKKLFVLFAVCVFVLTTAFCASAANTLKNGIYEVSITLLHAEKDKSSMGNNYIAQTALLEVKDGKKYLTMVPSKEVDNLQFWYYNDGSVNGNSTEATKIKNVIIKNKTYSVGYKFPIVSDGETVGVKFKAPIMPVTPSARVKIDYGSAAAVTSTAESEAMQVPAKQVSAAVQVSETQTEMQSTECAAVQTTVTESSDIEIAIENLTTDTVIKTTQTSADMNSSNIKTIIKQNTLPIIIFIAIAICIISLIIVFYKNKR